MRERNKTDTYRRLLDRLDPDASLRVYREHLDACVWMHMLQLTGMADLMDKTAKDKLYDDLCGDGVPEATEENVYATFNRLHQDAALIFRRGLARAFADLDRRFRSHDGFKIGSRVILTRVFDGMGHWNYHTRTFDTLTDIERAFAVLDGNRPNPGTLRAAIERDRGRGFNPRQSTTESDYFRVRIFKNGNAHLWFVRDDLVDKANAELAAYYGEVLADAVPAPGGPDIRTQAGALVKDLSFYPSPSVVVDTIMADLWKLDGCRALEPSAGTGSIVRALLDKGRAGHVDAIEVDAGRAATLRGMAARDRRLTVTEANFLTVRPRPVYDVVVMNPPFYGTHWMEHVTHAFEFLAPGGQLVSVLPISAELGTTAKHEAFRAWAQKHAKYSHRLFHDLPAESFAESGTRINTVYISLTRRA